MSHYMDQLTAMRMNKQKGHISPHKAIMMLKVGRNEPCPCGSGVKFKKCCG